MQFWSSVFWPRTFQACVLQESGITQLHKQRTNTSSLNLSFRSQVFSIPGFTETCIEYCRIFDRVILHIYILYALMILMCLICCLLPKMHSASLCLSQRTREDNISCAPCVCQHSSNACLPFWICIQLFVCYSKSASGTLLSTCNLLPLDCAHFLRDPRTFISIATMNQSKKQNICTTVFVSWAYSKKRLK